MKKLIKNKFFILAICVAAISIVYFCVQKAIDNYVFNSNDEIFIEDDLVNSDEVSVEKGTESESGMVEGENGTESENGTSEGGYVEELQQFSEEEINVETEEIEEVIGDNIAANRVEAEKVGEIYVYITGEVNNPGVVILNEGSRIVDAINAAGGITVKANVTKVNLVYVLNDGMKVNIPNSNDLKNNPDFEYITMSSGDGRNADNLDSGGKESGEGNSSNDDSVSSGSGSSKNYGIVNINTATQTELESLPGIGPSLALKIINYRKENGKFSCIEDIKNVSGIGESKFKDLKPYITV